MPAKTLDEEIYRSLVNRFNKVEPARRAKVNTVYATTADIYIEGPNITIPNVPILQPCYGTVGVVNLVAGDYVVIVFIGGKIGNPVIIGKY